MTDTPPEPSALDLENAARRREIADRQAAEYVEALKLALGTLGPHWKPWMKLVLLDSDHRSNGNREPAAIAYKVYTGALKLSDFSRYIRRMPDGTVLHSTRYEDVFPELHEEHPTRKLEIGGKMVPAPRWELCWGALNLYEPQSAEELAARRVTRERNQADREEKRWAAENPLMAWMDKQKEDGHSR